MKLTKEKLQFVIDNWESKTTEDIANELGVTINTVYKWVREYRNKGGKVPKKARRENNSNEIYNELIK
jgi:transposase